MSLHPDVLTDLVILYHAGEASQASRALLEEEAIHNAALAAALAAGPRLMQPIGAAPMMKEREVMIRVRRHYRIRAVVIIVLVVALVAVWSILRTPGSPPRGRGLPDTRAVPEGK